jgi:hypothetical protein
MLSSTSWKAPWCQCGCPGSRRNASRRGADDTAAAAARRRRRRRKMGDPITDGGCGETLGQGFSKLRRRSLLERAMAGTAEEGRRTGQRGGTTVHGECVVSPSLGVAVALRLVMFDSCGLWIFAKLKRVNFSSFRFLSDKRFVALKTKSKFIFLHRYITV